VLRCVRNLTPHGLSKKQLAKRSTGWQHELKKATCLHESP
jgi:hypothetical protein